MSSRRNPPSGTPSSSISRPAMPSQSAVTKPNNRLTVSTRRLHSSTDPNRYAAATALSQAAGSRSIRSVTASTSSKTDNPDFYTAPSQDSRSVRTSSTGLSKDSRSVRRVTASTLSTTTHNPCNTALSEDSRSVRSETASTSSMTTHNP